MLDCAARYKFTYVCINIETKTTCDLIMMFDAHTQRVDKNRNKNASLKYIAVHTSLYQTGKLLPNVCIIYIVRFFNNNNFNPFQDSGN